MKKIFITYANENFALSERQILKEARALGIFDKCIGYNPKDLPEYVKANPLMAFARGGGYWCWKPYVIWKTLQDYPDAIVVYADAGCKLQPGAEWNKWFCYLEKCDTLITAYRPDFDYEWEYNGQMVGVECERWIKKSMLDYFDALFQSDDWHLYPSLWAGFIIARSKSKLINEWFRFVELYPELISDDIMNTEQLQHDSYVAHRHDQSALTALAYWGIENGWNIKIIPETGESTQDAAVVGARRIIKPISFKTRIVNGLKFVLGEKLYKKIHS